MQKRPDKVTAHSIIHFHTHGIETFEDGWVNIEFGCKYYIRGARREKLDDGQIAYPDATCFLRYADAVEMLITQLEQEVQDTSKKLISLQELLHYYKVPLSARH